MITFNHMSRCIWPDINIAAQYFEVLVLLPPSASILSRVGRVPGRQVRELNVPLQHCGWEM